MKKAIPIIVAAVAIVVVAILIFKQGSPTPPASGVVLYYGQECPHCQRVEQYLQDNKVDEKVKINKLEVWHNQDNAALMTQAAKKCGITGDQLGVPFMTADGKCYEGEDEVRNFFSQYVTATSTK